MLASIILLLLVGSAFFIGAKIQKLAIVLLSTVSVRLTLFVDVSGLVPDVEFRDSSRFKKL